jgi:hypothetical protein
MKRAIISSAICSIIFYALGIGSYFLYQNRQNNQLKENIIVKTIQGNPGIIEHEKIKNYPKHIEIVTKSKGKGKIKTTIKKVDFCPKIYKNSLSFVLYGGLSDHNPNISYGLQYQRTIFSRFHLLTGIKVDTDAYRVNGFQLFAGAGVNF